MPITKQRPPVEDANLPYNEEAEIGVLGSILISEGAVLPEVRAILAPEDFRHKHSLIYATMLEMADEGDPVDVSTVVTELMRRGKMDAEDAGYASSLPNHLTTEHNYAYYARVVKEASVKRLMIQVGADIAATGYSDLALGDAIATLERLYTETRTQIGDAGIDFGDVFTLLSGDDMEDIAPANGIVGDILYEDSIAILYGASGRWKSFLALDWSLRIATGQNWFGRSVREGHVVYIAGEGGRGIGKRVSAWRKHHLGVEAPRFHLLPIAVSLLDESQVEKLVRTIKATLGDEAPVLIVVDTLSRSMPGGDENAGKDGSKAIAAADALRQAFTGTTVMLVAHPGKNEGAGIRGWSGYFQWADTVIHVSASDTKPRLDCGDVVKLESEKPKDSEPFTDIYYTAQKVEWTDLHGRDLSSLILVSSEAPAKDGRSSGETLTGKQREVLNAIAEHGGPMGFNEIVETTGIRRDTVNTSLKRLQELGYVVKTGNLYDITPTSPVVRSGPVR